MERKAKYVVRLDEVERGRLQEMVDRGKGSKTIRNRALDPAEGRRGRTRVRGGPTRRSPRRSTWACGRSSAPAGCS